MNDWLADPKDVRLLAHRLPNVVFEYQVSNAFPAGLRLHSTLIDSLSVEDLRSQSGCQHQQIFISFL
ncbi:hypothetical protein HPB48_026541 [Haemaphysalis longicornis]|uniref:Uncharacterized protein n=1 Tax=Haemaphysalis longicornis TaxID=44386 RepID=A0A9J6HCK2_HAELO|nr:hypothetical protein HPB48_026541 [Haemaphysalis longicornis]